MAKIVRALGGPVIVASALAVIVVAAIGVPNVLRALAKQDPPVREVGRGLTQSMFLGSIIEIVPRRPSTSGVFPINVDVTTTHEELSDVRIEIALDEVDIGGLRIEHPNRVQKNYTDRLPAGQSVTTSVPRPGVNGSEEGAVTAATITARAEFAKVGVTGRFFVKGVYRLSGVGRQSLKRRWDLVGKIERGVVEERRN